MKVQRPGSPILQVVDVPEDTTAYLRDENGLVVGIVRRYGTTRDGLIKFVPGDGGNCYVEVKDASVAKR